VASPRGNSHIYGLDPAQYAMEQTNKLGQVDPYAHTYSAQRQGSGRTPSQPPSPGSAHEGGHPYLTPSQAGPPGGFNRRPGMGHASDAGSCDGMSDTGRSLAVSL
jgi:hypothetical protein